MKRATESRLLDRPATLWGGLVVTLICCFTPVLVVLFSLAGLGALIGYLDFALMPLLGFFIAALARIYSWRGEGRTAWAAGGAALLFLGILFGRANPILPVLIAAGALIALLAYRRKGGGERE